MFFSDYLQNGLGPSSLVGQWLVRICTFWIRLWRAQTFSYFHKMAAIGHFGFQIFAKIDWVLRYSDILDHNYGCVKYEFDMGIGVAVM